MYEHNEDEYSIQDDFEDNFEWLESDVSNEVDNLLEDFDDTQGLGIESRTNKSALFGFISSLQLMEYNFYGKLARTCDYAFIKERIDTNINTADKISEYIGYNKKKLNDIYYYNILLRQVSYIETSAREGGASFSLLLEENGEKLLGELAKLNTDSVVFLEDELSSNDVSMHIKSALLPYALYYEAFIKKTTSKNRSDLESYILMIVKMTKDISTKWSRNQGDVDKILMFTVTLPIVARFCMQYTESYIDDKLSSNVDGFKFGNKDIYKAIANKDGGYNDFPELKKELYEKITKLVDGYLDNYISSSWNSRKLFPREIVKLIILEELYDTWNDFMHHEVSSFLKLSEDKQNQYIKNNDNLINTELFFDMIKIKCRDTISSLFEINVKWTDIEVGVRDKFSMYWGVSDAVYKNL